MVYYNSKEIEINYLYLEFPKKEYYLVSNLDNEHNFEYIKPIGQDLVDFLNMDLLQSESNLELLKNILLAEIPGYEYKIHALNEFCLPLAQQNFL